MNFGRGSPVAQKNEIVQNGDSWISLTPPGKLILPRSAPVPVDLQGNRRNRNWQDLLGMYSEILNHDVAVQTPNPTSVTSINGRNFDLIGVGTEANQRLNRNVDAYVQNFSNDSAGSCNNRPTKVLGIRTTENNNVLSSGQRNNGQISIRRTDSCTQVEGNWTELESTSLMFGREHSIRRTDSNSCAQVASNWTELEPTNLMLDRQHSISGSSLMLDRQHSISGSNHMLNSLNTQVGSNWMQREASMLFGKQNSTVGSNQRFSEASSLHMPNNGYHVPYRTSYNLYSPPRPVITNAELSVASSFPFAPVTPDQGKQLDHQTPSERLNVSLDECSSQEKDKQWHVVSSTSGENENHPNEFSQVIVDAASAAISTPHKEANIFNEIEEHGLDLNKTPDQKTPKKRKIRPKVVKEGKPKKVPKSATPKTEVRNGTPSGKRKYVRKKNIKTVESQDDVVVNEVRPTVESLPKSCRRVLNFDLESSTGDASQNMIDGHPAGRHQEKKRPFNLNADAEDKETCTVIDSMSRTSSCQMEEYRQQKEFIEKNQQTASAVGLFCSNDQMPSQLNPLTEQRVPRTQPAKEKDHTFARNLNMRNAAPGQSSLKNGYIQVPEHTRREEISQDVFQADSLSANFYRQPSTQLVMKDTAHWNENRGFKRSHCHTVQEIHPYNQNMMIPPFLSLGNCYLKNKNDDSSNITSGTQKRLNTGNELHVNFSNMHSSTNASLYCPGQVEGDQVRMYANSGSSELNCRLLNSGFERDKTSKKLNCSVNGTPRTPMTGKQNYHKLQASITLHPHRGQMTEPVYRYEASTSDSQQAIVGYNPHMSTSKQVVKPSPLKQGSRRAEKMLVQQHNYALQCYKQTPKKARGKLGKHKMSLLIEEITFRLEALLINIKRNEEAEQEQHALVPYKGSSTIVPYERFDIKKRKPRPKVDLDPETDRIWKLLMGIEGSESAEATDKDKEKWWEGEREVFRGRADSFIARMHLVQGDRRFSRWKGSVVDSVIGVFLTQNVSDHLSSSAFMSLVARFPLQSSGLVEEPDIQVLESSGSIKCHEEIERQPIHNLPSYIPPDYFDNLPSYKANVTSDYNRKSDAEINVSRNSYDPLNFHASQEKIISNTRSHSMAELQGTGYKSIVNCSPLKTVLQTEVTLQKGIYNHVNSSSGISTQRHELSEDPILGRHNYLRGPAIFPHQTNSHILHGPVLSSRDIHLNLTPKSIVNDSRKFGLPGDETLPCFLRTHTVTTKTDGANLMKRCTRDMAEGKTPPLQNGVPNVQANLGSFTFPGIRSTQVGSVQPEHSPHSNKHELENSKSLHSELTIATKPETPATNETHRINGQHSQKLSDNIFESNANMVSNSSVMPLSGTSTNVSHARKGKGEAGRKIKIDWDNLRKNAQTNGKRERSNETMDSMDYEAMRCANVNEISDAIRERGMNNMLAERIKDFLDRLVNDHGSIDLEWLRDVPPDKAKDYLLSVRGLGLKSVECVRLLTLHQLAFPVDTNVGRIAVRLGWVPLQPLPESLQLHLLELYPILESIQKYLWPRLCKLDQQTLYELHYQMITFGKVFCTKSKPNCNACPMRGECRHFASAFASARLALPGPEEKSLVSSAVPITTDSDPLAAVKPVQLLEGVQDLNNGAGLITKKYEPIVEEPSTPEQEIIELVESDIEDAFGEDPDEIPTIKLNLEEFAMNLQNYMQDNMELQEGDMSRALVALNPEAASIPTPKLKNVSRLRTEHQVYELPDSHPLLEGLDSREPDDPSPYLLAIWTPGETADSVQPPEKRCETHESGQLCNDDTCFSCNSTREANSQIVRGTLLIPCRTAMRGSFPLNGTYFQVNEMFADHESSLNPIDVPRSLIWNLPRRTVYFGTSVTSIFKGLPTEGIQYCFWRGFVCVRGFDHKQRAPRPLMARLHFPASRLAKAKK